MNEFDTLKENLKKEYQSIADVVFLAPALVPLEQEIRRRIEANEDCSTLVKGYIANVIVTAREYLDSKEKVFKVFIHEDFLTTALKSPESFNSDDKFIGQPENTIIAIPLFDKVTIDLCFGLYANVKDKFTSNFFVLFYRKDLTDKQVMIKIKEMIDLKDYNVIRSKLKELINNKIVFVRKDK